MPEQHWALLVHLVVLAVGLLHGWEVVCYHQPLNSLPVAEQKVVALKTENAFYYSFYEEAVAAPSLAEAVRGALRDRRSEAPDTINAVRRFNIYQELLCGLLYRLLRQALGEELVVDPWYFFRYCSYTLQAFGHVALAHLASGLGGGGLRGGVLPAALLACWLFLHRKEASRIHDVGMLNLREHWAMPVILCQVLTLQKLLGRHAALVGTYRSTAGYRRWMWAFRGSTVACLLLWQFSAFAFMLQVSALFLCTLLSRAAGPRRALRDVIGSHLGCAAVAATLLFGNELLVHHMLVTECLAILAVLRLRRSPASVRALFWVDGALAVGLFCALRLLQWRWATAEEHIGEIFAAKIRQIYPDLLGEARSEPTFNARLYFAVSVFDFIDLETIRSALPTGLYHGAFAGALVWAMAFAGHVLLGECAAEEVPATADGCEPSPGKAAAVDAGAASDQGLRRRRPAPSAAAAGAAGVPSAGGGAHVAEVPAAGGSAHGRGCTATAPEYAEAFGYGVLFAQLGMFLALGCFISRLKVLGAPFLCALAAVSAAPRPLEVALQPVLQRCSMRCAAVLRGGMLAVAVAAQLGQLAFLVSRLPFLEGHGLDSHRDMVWSDGDRGELYHWMVEHLHPDATIIASMPLSAELRLNTPFRLAIHPQFESKALRDRVQEIYEFYMCTPPERVASTMRKYGSSHIVLEYKRCNFSPFLLDKHPELNCEKGERPWEALFCPLAHASPLFRPLFANAGFAVLRLADDGALAAEARHEIEDLEVWAPMLEQCLLEEAQLCVARTAELASMFHSKLGQPRVADALFGWVRRHAGADGQAQYIIGHHLDYDAKRPSEAAAFYRRAYELAPNNAVIVREYLLWLDLEAKDNRTLEALLRLRRATRGKRLSLLELGDVALACEASVPARELLRDDDWAEDLWGLAAAWGAGSPCVRNNWPLFNDGRSLEASLGDWGLFLDIFWHRRMRSELVSTASSGVRYQPPRARWRLGLAASFDTATRAK